MALATNQLFGGPTNVPVTPRLNAKRVQVIKLAWGEKKEEQKHI